MTAPAGPLTQARNRVRQQDQEGEDRARLGRVAQHQARVQSGHRPWHHHRNGIENSRECPGAVIGENERQLPRQQTAFPQKGI
jgi:hypothetical protein